ncbi:MULTISPECIES: ABC-three component system protein [Methylobacterium]|nr:MULTISPECIES: ABC-three component system protein [Methylobacterium]
MRLANPHHQLHFFGKMSFKKVIFSLEEPDVVRLIGRAASLADFENLQPPEVVAVLQAVVKATSDDLPDDDEPAPVPRDKLRYNAITGAVARKVAMGQTNSDIVRAHIDNDPNPLLGITIANEFRRRYKELDLQDLTPNEVMLGLYDGIVGTGNPTQERDVAAWSLLAYLFTACTVFKDRPIEVAT